jgi:YD repeat-containing protein
MKHLGNAVLLSLLVFVTACSTDGADKTEKEGGATDSTKQESVQMQGNMKRVYAVGHFVGGVQTDDWLLHEEARYDENGHEISRITYSDPAQPREETTYDADGYEILKVVKGAGGVEVVQIRSTWNADHTEQSTEEFSTKDSRVVRKIVNHFDSKGTLIAFEEEDRRFLEAITTYQVRMVLDGAGRVKEQIERFDGKEMVGIQYTYDAQGNPLQIVRMDNEGKPSQTEYFEYDSAGHKTAHYLQDHHAYFATKQLEAKYEYDTQGRLTKEVHYKGLCDERGVVAGKCPISVATTLSYDAQGRLISKVEEYPGTDKPSMKMRFEYSGNVPAK